MREEIRMKGFMLAISAALPMVVAMHATAAGDVTTDGTPIRIAQSPGYQSDVSTGRTSMTATQQAQYKTDYQAAKSQWAKMTPEQQAATIKSAREKKLQDLSAIELVGQRDDMQREAAAQSAALKAEADAAKAQWNKMTPEQKQAARKTAWAKKRAELDGIERVGQRDDSYVLPW
jgi:hypothetical protein